MAALPDPPVVALLDQLDSPYFETRLAAVRALGQIDARPVTQTLVRRLASIVECDFHRQEAMAVLFALSPHCPQAGDCVAAALRSPVLLPALRSARAQLPTPTAALTWHSPAMNAGRPTDPSSERHPFEQEPS